jgi:mono/diheme cytochrome c family protein
MKNGAYAVAFLGALIIIFSQSFAGNPPNAATQASSDRGVTIFRKSCSVCHNIRSGETKVVPSLCGVLRERSGLPEQAVRQAIADGKDTMPACKTKLEPGEIDDLIKYLRTL